METLVPSSDFRVPEGASPQLADGSASLVRQQKCHHVVGLVFAVTSQPPQPPSAPSQQPNTNEQTLSATLGC